MPPTPTFLAALPLASPSITALFIIADSSSSVAPALLLPDDTLSPLSLFGAGLVMASISASIETLSRCSYGVSLSARPRELALIYQCTLCGSYSLRVCGQLPDKN